MNYLSNEEVLSIKSIGNWNVSECPMSGTIEWWNTKSDSIVYATPNWTEDGIVPIDISNENGEYETLSQLSLKGSLSEQLNQYKEILKSILKNL